MVVVRMTVKKETKGNGGTKPENKIETTINNRLPLFNNVSHADKQSDINSPLEYKKLEIWEQLILKTWINENFVKRITVNKYHSSYEQKHIFERSPDGFYVTNGAFKGAMLDCGFDKHSEDGIKWYFAITEKSIKAAKMGVV